MFLFVFKRFSNWILQLRTRKKDTLTQNENFTLYFLNSFIVCMHVVVRFTHAYRDFVADYDCAFFYSNPISIQASTPEKRVPYVGRWFINSFKTVKKTLQQSTDNKKIIYCYKTLANSDSTPFKRSKKPTYWCAQGGVYVKWYRTSFWLH